MWADLSLDAVTWLRISFGCVSKLLRIKTWSTASSKKRRSSIVWWQNPINLGRQVASQADLHLTFEHFLKVRLIVWWKMRRSRFTTDSVRCVLMLICVLHKTFSVAYKCEPSGEKAICDGSHTSLESLCNWKLDARHWNHRKSFAMFPYQHYTRLNYILIAYELDCCAVFSHFDAPSHFSQP